jgi:hypothetical protein
VETIAKECFTHCTSLSRVIFEPTSRVANLGESAFEGCSALQSISLPQSLETILLWCFSGCQTLASITLETGYNLSAQLVSDLRLNYDVTVA